MWYTFSHIHLYSPYSTLFLLQDGNAMLIQYIQISHGYAIVTR